MKTNESLIEQNIKLLDRVRELEKAVSDMRVNLVVEIVHGRRLEAKVAKAKAAAAKAVKDKPPLSRPPRPRYEPDWASRGKGEIELYQ